MTPPLLYHTCDIIAKVLEHRFQLIKTLKFSIFFKHQEIKLNTNARNFLMN